jgi:hypothetical protein
MRCAFTLREESAFYNNTKETPGPTNYFPSMGAQHLILGNLDTWKRVSLNPKHGLFK